jgi:4-amino-4-deoxy-L-arabinose transferase-like glycosyltransferase
MLSIVRENTIILVIIGLINLGFVYTYVHSLTLIPGNVIPSTLTLWQDTPSYLNAMHYIDGSGTGTDISSYLQRMLTTPLMLASSMAIGSLFGDYSKGMFFLNVAFYLFSIPVFYRIGMLVYDDTRTAFIGTILFITSWGIFSFGPTYLADMGGWFFFLLTTLCALTYYRNPGEKRFFYLGILSSIIGVLFKEYGALGMSSLILLTLMVKEKTLTTRMKEALIAVALFGGALLLYYIWFYTEFNYSYLDWYRYNIESYGGEDATSTNMYNVTDLIKVVVLIFFAGWPLFLIGAIREIRDVLRGNQTRLMILLALLPASLAFLLWPAFTHRVAVILIPWVALVAAFGVARIQSRWLIAFILVLYVFVNYHTNYLMSQIDLPF